MMNVDVNIKVRILLEWRHSTLSERKKNRITVDIYGQQYVIVGEESASHIRHVAELVDEKMREINSKNPSLDTSKLAVLTAVNAIHDYVKLQEEYLRLKKEFNKLKGDDNA
jgi:cell division protein ZapA